jgi:hypothetical protein
MDPWCGYVIRNNQLHTIITTSQNKISLMRIDYYFQNMGHKHETNSESKLYGP